MGLAFVLKLNWLSGKGIEITRTSIPVKGSLPYRFILLKRILRIDVCEAILGKSTL